MSLQKLSIYTLRNIHALSIEPVSGINLITGENASGKSSLLEALFILGRARSFRAPNLKHVIQFNQSAFVVSASAQAAGESIRQMGIKYDGKHCEIRINQQDSSKANLAYSFPVIFIHPKSYLLLEGGAQLRREFLDWGVFNDQSDFLIHWRQFKKTLQQRNALLKSKRTNQLNVWNTEFAEYGTMVSLQREVYLEQLQPLFYEISRFFLSDKTVQIQFSRGWDKSTDLLHALENDKEKDLRYGFTHSGPHRDNFLILIDGRVAKDYVSRGQLKLLMLSLKLAQIKLIGAQDGFGLCLLIDDLTAELDVTNKQKLLHYLDKLDCQVFMSSTELSNFGDLTGIENYKVFHVEHGEIKNI